MTTFFYDEQLSAFQAGIRSTTAEYHGGQTAADSPLQCLDNFEAWLEEEEDGRMIPDTLPLPDDHDDRIRVARKVAGWHLGDAEWADLILIAYFDPAMADTGE